MQHITEIITAKSIRNASGLNTFYKQPHCIMNRVRMIRDFIARILIKIIHELTHLLQRSLEGLCSSGLPTGRLQITNKTVVELPTHVVKLPTNVVKLPTNVVELPTHFKLPTHVVKLPTHVVKLPTHVVKLPTGQTTNKCRNLSKS